MIIVHNRNFVKPMQNTHFSIEISLSSKGQNKSKILLSKICILHRLVLLNNVLFKPLSHIYDSLHVLISLFYIVLRSRVFGKQVHKKKKIY